MFHLHVILTLLLFAGAAYVSAPTLSSAHTAMSAPSSTVTVARIAQVPTPLPNVIPQQTAPIGKGTQQVLLVIGAVLSAAVLIGGGIYLYRRWLATSY